MRTEQHRSNSPAIGGTSLLVTFSVICLAVFSVLSLTTAQAEKRLSDKAADLTSAYYRADTYAEEIFAQLRRGENHEAVSREGNVYTYEVPIANHKSLLIQLQNDETGWTVLRWQSRSHPDSPNTNMLPVWDGSFLQEVSP